MSDRAYDTRTGRKVKAGSWRTRRVRKKEID